MDLASMEMQFIMSAQECIISQFKQNKRYIEKELFGLLSQAKKLKKAAKDKVDDTQKGIDALLDSVQNLKQEYSSLTNLEDAFQNSLQQRLNHLADVRKA